MAAIALASVGAAPEAAARTARAAYSAAPGPVYEAIMLDADTGQVLRESNPDVTTPPASLAKMMTLYLTFEALNSGRLRLDQWVYVSSEAAAHSPSKLGLSPGEPVLIRDMVLGLVTRSANDAAGVLAEALAGSEAAFAERMNYKARQLGMTSTLFRNASGLPDPEQRTTARDMARIALALYQHFPREYRYFSIQEFEFRGQPIHTHNHLLEWYEGADGIKTGYVHASGFNLAASATRNGHRLIAVIMGGNSARSRDREMGALLDQGFADIGQPMVARAVAPAVPAAAAVPALATAAPRPAAPAQIPGGDTAERQDTLGSVARTALRHLSPVSRAEAAPMTREAPPAGEEWAVQLGAFRGEQAAEQAARSAGALPMTRGKQQQVLAPARGERPALYRAQLFPFTAKAAQAACAALHRKGLECTVVHARTRLASQTR